VSDIYGAIKVSAKGNRSSRPTKHRRATVYALAGYRCQECGKQFTEPHPDEPGRYVPSLPYVDATGKPRLCSLDVDHIVSVRNGGTNAPENLRALCTQCNTRKGAN
jgi:5-methylcytosine-specific restriction endonuclease McrA